MSRKLLPATIIASDLYVERFADRQLAEIIKGMGRPGYVLVARQMGKTNLLLNARRRLESKDLLFVYVDLSTTLPTISDYYRLILSTAAAVHPHLLSAAPREALDPIQFDRVLREILGRFQGRLVIVLDEIDSLANCSFSDQVFSQIRSMYFARTNYPVFDRLTYILSGVAEPADLIKDKNISPFNIGAKIYLNDFTLEELQAFLTKASLQMDATSIEALWQWTGGNPRMTWDVCSELEEARATGALVTPELISRIINDLYLTTFDRAPVDHIRTLVQADREVRGAVRSLILGDASAVSDKIRSKLYLAGIVSMQVGQPASALKIKNRVLEEALSEKWLFDVERTSRDLLQVARGHADDERYDAALPYFEEYLLQSEIEPKSADTLRVAQTYLHTGRYSKAIEWYNKYLPTVAASKELSAQVHFDLGRSFLQLNDPNTALTHLRVGASTPSVVQDNATNALASTLIRVDGEAALNEAEELCKVLLGANTAVPTSSIRASALRNLATINLKRGNQPVAIRYIEDAIAIGDVVYRPYLIAELIDLGVDEVRRNALLDTLAKSVVELIQLPTTQHPDGGIESIALKSLVLTRAAGRASDFDQIILAYERATATAASDRYKLYTKLSAESSQTPSAKKLTDEFLRELVEKYFEVAVARADVVEALKTLIARTQDHEYAVKYAQVREADSVTSLDEYDFIAMGFSGLVAMQRTDNELHRRLNAIVNVVQDETKHRHTLGYCWLFFNEIDRQVVLGDADRATKAANIVLELIDDLIKRSDTPLPLYNQMKERALKHLRTFQKPERAVNRFKHLGRNTWVRVKYSDGRVVRQKFKTLQRDLVLETCELIEDQVDLN